MTSCEFGYLFKDPFPSKVAFWGTRGLRLQRILFGVGGGGHNSAHPQSKTTNRRKFRRASSAPCEQIALTLCHAAHVSGYTTSSLSESSPSAFLADNFFRFHGQTLPIFPLLRVLGNWGLCQFFVSATICFFLEWGERREARSGPVS